MRNVACMASVTYLDTKSFMEGPAFQISGFLRGINEIYLLLGCYTVQLSYSPTFRDNL